MHSISSDSTNVVLTNDLRQKRPVLLIPFQRKILYICALVSSNSLFTFQTGEEYFAAIVVLAILLVISLAVIAYFIYENRRFKSSKTNPENKNKERNDSKDDYEIPATHDENYEQVENEQPTYTALKKPGERDDYNHVYCHLNEVQKDNARQEETGI